MLDLKFKRKPTAAVLSLIAATAFAGAVQAQSTSQSTSTGSAPLTSPSTSPSQQLPSSLDRPTGMSSMGPADSSGGSQSGATQSSSGASQSSSGASGTESMGASGSSGTTGASNPEASSGSSKSSGRQASTANHDKRSLNAADQSLTRQLAYANLAEIEAGRLAQSKSTNDQVKSFAQQMVDDHGRALQQLQQLADSKGLTLPTKPDSAQRKQLQQLGKLSGEAFDKKYLANAGVSDHRKTHALVAKVQSKALDADLRQLATAMLPNIDQHLQLAQQARSAESKSTGSSSGAAKSNSGAMDSSGSSSAPASSNTSGMSGSLSGPDSMKSSTTGTSSNATGSSPASSTSGSGASR